jgi:hypothetical protein
MSPSHLRRACHRDHRAAKAKDGASNVEERPPSELGDDGSSLATDADARRRAPHPAIVTEREQGFTTIPEEAPASVVFASGLE